MALIVQWSMDYYGMATVYKRMRPRPGKPDLVTWEARWRDPTGTQRRKSFTKKSDAERYMTGLRSRMSDGSYVDPTAARVTFGEYAERWLAGRTRLKPKTAFGYRSLLDTRVLPRWRDVPLNRITYEDARDWVAEMSAELSPSRTRQAYFVLTSVLNEAVKGRRLPANPVLGVELPRLPQGRQRYLTAQQVERLADALGDQGVVVRVLAYTGIRWGELAGIRVKAVAPDASRLHICEAMAEVNGRAIFGPPKTHADRWVGVPGKLRPAILARMEGKAPDDLVFTTDRGTVLRVNNFRRTQGFDRAAESTGVPGLVPHELRHTAASLAISAGGNVKHVQQMLGHASAAMTLDRYGHLMEDAADQVAAGIDGLIPECVPVVSPDHSGEARNGSVSV